MMSASETKVNEKPYIGSFHVRGNKICAKRNRPYGVNVTLATIKPIPSYGTTEEGQANIPLFAAASELLAALEGVVRCLEQHLADAAKAEGVKPEVLCPCWTTELAAAKAAIAKARGAA